MYRRGFLYGLGASGLFPALPAHAGNRYGLYVTCAARPDGSYAASGFDGTGRQVFEISLPERGHGMAFHPSRRECVVLARRPGTFAAVIDLPTGKAPRWIEAAAGRHFYGHGAFSPDGAFFFATENDYETGRGVLGVYDTANGYARLGEIASNGIGPHQVRLTPDGKSLAVANGGIRTHPLNGRDKLNLGSMAPNLSLLALKDGAVRRVYALPPALHQLSIRHIDMDRRQRVAVSMQYEGAHPDDIALVALAAPETGMQLLRAPVAVEKRLRQYTGAVAFDSSGRYVAASGPRGGIAVIWDAQTGTYLRQIEAPDTSGIAATAQPGEFMLSGGDGAIRRADIRSGTTAMLAPPNRAHRWDNHLEPEEISGA